MSVYSTDIRILEKGPCRYAFYTLKHKLLAFYLTVAVFLRGERAKLRVYKKIRNAIVVLMIYCNILGTNSCHLLYLFWHNSRDWYLSYTIFVLTLCGRYSFVVLINHNVNIAIRHNISWYIVLLKKIIIWNSIYIVNNILSLNISSIVIGIMLNIILPN